MNKDVVELKYLRFQTSQLEKTIEFYKTLGMHLDYLLKQEAWDKSISFRIAALSFDSFQLLFEEIPGKEEPFHYNHSISSDDSELKRAMDAIKAACVAKKQPEHAYEYMVFYCRDVDRYSQLLEAKGYWCEKLTVHDMQVAIFRDPSNIQVRLIEMDPLALNQTTNWFIKFGYYAIPTTKGQESVLSYDSFFHGKEEQDRLVDVDGNLVNMKSFKKLTSSFVYESALRRTGFRLVDLQNMNVGLNHHTFYWLGNDIRTVQPCICLVQIHDVDLDVCKKENLQVQGLGLNVINLEAKIAKIKYETMDACEWDVRYKTPFGVISRFKDANNPFWVELLCQRKEDLSWELAAIQTPLTLINKDHLRGTKKTLSLNAIQKLKKPIDNTVVKEQVVLPTNIIFDQEAELFDESRTLEEVVEQKTVQLPFKNVKYPSTQW